MTQENLRGFLARVESAGDPATLAEEFTNIRVQAAAFRQKNNLTTEIGGNKDNLKKNRYKDILPYDQTRVPLTLLVEDGQSDYINASFIQGLDNKQCYIATQGPLSHTQLDFWRMVWEYRVKVIVMACREVELGKKKCECYWPKDTEPSIFGPFSVSMVEEKNPSLEVVLRTLQVTFQKEVRVVTHLQYVAWPDRGIPDSYDCFLELIRLVREYQGVEVAPVCVHCSAGCGRTGVICTVEYVQNLINKKRVPNNFSLFQIVLEIRQQRPSAVQTKEQYEFVYHVVTEMFKRELKSCSSPCYENLVATETKVSLYDDVGSLKPEPGLSRPKPSKGSRSKSFAAPRLTPPGPEPLAPPSKEMNDTYAVVSKVRPPRVTNQLPPPAQYDNVNPPKSLSAPNPAALYSAVKPKARNGASPTAQSPEGQKLNGGRTPLLQSYSLAMAPALPDRPQENNYAALYIRGTETEERGSPSGSWLSDVPSSWSERVDTNAASSQAGAARGNNKLRNMFKPGFTSPPQKKGSIPGQESIESYEDLPDPSRCLPAGQTLTNALGFNNRIGKPKGPRDPPAEWSRLER